jgi:hypothetical protein
MMKKKPNRLGQKMFIVRKYIMARSAAEAMRKDKKTLPDDVFIDTDWQKGNASTLASAMGFTLP